MGPHFSGKKKRLRQRTHKLGASKILVPRKNGEPERRSLSVCRGARGAAGPPPGGLGGWKPPRKSRGSGGRQPPSKNNFMDPEPGFWDQDMVFFVPKIWGPFFWEKKAPAATYPQVKGFQKFGPLGIQAEKQGFRTAWLITGQKFP